MSMWVRCVCKKSLASVTSELLVQAVAGRLPQLVTRYASSLDEPLRGVLAQLRAENEDNLPYSPWRIHYSADAQQFIRVERTVGRELEQDRRDMFDEMTGKQGEAADRIRALLSQTKENVRIELSATDATGVGLPLAVAAAAALAGAGEGLVRVDGEGWLAPKGKDVELLLAEGT